MKKHKYILLFIVFVLGFLISDRIIAQWLNSILYSVSSGTHAEARIAMYEQKSEILILGSSRAQSHFDPLAITKVTGLSCYNAGMVSQGYDYTEIITSVMLKRYSPEFVVIEVTPTFFDESIYNIANAVLLPFAYDEKSILNFLERDDKFIKVKSTISQSFLFNSAVFKLMIRHFFPKDVNSLGFAPILKKNLNFEFSTKQRDFSRMKISKIQMEAFINSVNMFKKHNVKIIATISPIYLPEWGENDKFIMQLKEIIKSVGGEFLDYSRDPRFMREKELCYDDLHLMGTAATEFSYIFGADLNKLSHLRTK